MSTEFLATAICGPSGGMGGQPFHDDVTPTECRVITVRIYASDRLYGIQSIHATCDGLEHAFPLHGHATGDCYLLEIAPDEFITAIRGRHDVQVMSIRFQTNKQTSPCFGGAGGMGAYQYQAPPGTEIVGFCGRADDGLHAVGVILRRRGL